MLASDIAVRYSGGASNSDPALSLGGAMSSTEVISQTVATPSVVTGVSIVRAVNLPNPVSLFTAGQYSPRRVGWWGPEQLSGIIQVSADGQYTIYSPSGDPKDGFMVVDVTYASIATSGTLREDLTVTDSLENLFNDVVSAEASTGSTKYRCVYVRNGHASETIATLKLWVGKEYDGDESVAIAIDSNGVGGTATTIVDENDSTNLLSGLTFTSPLTEATGLSVSSIAPSSWVPIWIRRTVNAEVQEALGKDSFGISIAAYV